jgi:hypothetical protein
MNVPSKVLKKAACKKEKTELMTIAMEHICDSCPDWIRGFIKCDKMGYLVATRLAIKFLKKQLIVHLQIFPSSGLQIRLQVKSKRQGKQ